MTIGHDRRNLDVLWAGVAILLPALLVSLAPLSTIDLGYGIRAGGMFLDGASIQRVDTFTFTAASLPWLNQQWLGQVLFAAVHRAGGWPALAALWTAIVVAIQAFLWRAARWMGADARWAGVALLAGFVVAAQGIGLRAQVLGLLCLAALLAVGAARGSHPRVAWLAVPLLAAWANVHGSFPLGLFLLGLLVVQDAAAGRRWRASLVVLAAASLATLINPFGIDAWRYVASIGTDPTIARFVTEWRHTSLLDPAGAVFYASVVAVGLLVGVLARRPGTLRVAMLPWLAGLAVLGAWAVRGVAWWGVGAAPVVALLLTTLAAGQGGREPAVSRPGPAAGASPAADASPAAAPVAAARRGRIPLVTVTVLAFLVLAIQPAWRPSEDGEGLGSRLRDAPPGIASAVADAARAARVAGRPAPRVFNAQRWGSWLELDVPEVPVFADSRIELIPADAWRDYALVSEGDAGWLQILDAWAVDVVVVAIADQPSLAGLIGSETGWRVTYENTDGLVAVRRAGSGERPPPSEERPAAWHRGYRMAVPVAGRPGDFPDMPVPRLGLPEA